MNKISCPECHGTGFWEGDERGNAYYDSVKCEDCKGTGYLEVNKMQTLKAVNEDEWHGLIYACPHCKDESLWKGFSFCPSCGKTLKNYNFSNERPR